MLSKPRQNLPHHSVRVSGLVFNDMYRFDDLFKKTSLRRGKIRKTVYLYICPAELLRSKQNLLQS